MKKKILILIIVLVAISSISFYLFTRKPSVNGITPKNFIKHFNKSSSKIYKDCLRDSDCKLQYLGNACGFIEVINKNNSKNDIENYINKELELTSKVLFDCKNNPQIEDLKSTCEDKICETQAK
ncbi:MAG: hypothetical protein V1770_06140 [bacterium]